MCRESYFLKTFCDSNEVMILCKNENSLKKHPVK
jgi:hypothetical protein